MSGALGYMADAAYVYPANSQGRGLVLVRILLNAAPTHISKTERERERERVAQPSGASRTSS
jgi:hypothetical protein